MEMPTYDLTCVDCGHGFEVFHQRFLRDEDRTCARCGTGGAQQRITGFITSRPPRQAPEPRVTGFAGAGCCGGACTH